jgi:hypothetical protein
MLACTLAIDFEGDQWTFYKPSHTDLYVLYGIQVEELTLWKGLVPHVVEQVDRVRIPLVEVDSFYLPDTEGRDYGTTHTKTTVGIESIDPSREYLRYFHNRGRFTLTGADYRGVLRLEPEASDSDLMPYAEIAKVDRVRRLDKGVLFQACREIVLRAMGRRPTVNPIARYAASVEADLSALIASEADGHDLYDLYAFASIRQCGSGFAFSADCLRWLAEEEGGARAAWVEAANCFARISSLASMLVLKMARIVHSGRSKDLSETFDEMASCWEQGMVAIDRALKT